jgi:hypothetical protein
MPSNVSQVSIFAVKLKILLYLCWFLWRRKMRIYVLFAITLKCFTAVSFRQIPFYMEQRAYVQFLKRLL